MKATAFLLAVGLTIGSGLLGQVTVHVPDNTLSGAGNLIPLWANSNASYTYVARVPASFLGGVYGLRQLREISLAPSGAGYVTSAWTSNNIRIGVGHVPTPLPIPFSFPSTSPGSFLDFTLLHDSAVNGPFIWVAASGAWSPLGFGVAGGTSFCWDGIHDLGVFITTQGATSGGMFGGTCTQSTTEPLRVYASAFNATISTASGAGGLKMKLDFVACPSAPPLFETNDPASSLDLGGLQGTTYIPAVTHAVNGFPVTFHANSTGLGLPWEVAFNLSPVVPPTLISNGGQYVNLDLNAGLFFVFGGLWPAFPPFPGNQSVVVTPGGPPAVVSFQQINGDPSHPDGVSLSQPCELRSSPFSPVLPGAGPACDDCAVAVSVGGINGLYGHIYQSLFVQSNGRLMFGGGNAYPTPSLNRFLVDPPSFGVWADFDPSALGSVVLSQPTPDEIRVDYLGVAYKGTTTANTFALIYNQVTGHATIDGLLGLMPSALGHQMLIGISGGSTVMATSSGSVAFGPPPGVGTTSNSTDAVYEIGTAGTLAPGVNRIVFIPNGYGNYDWTSN